MVYPIAPFPISLIEIRSYVVALLVSCMLRMIWKVIICFRWLPIRSVQAVYGRATRLPLSREMLVWYKCPVNCSFENTDLTKHKNISFTIFWLSDVASRHRTSTRGTSKHFEGLDLIPASIASCLVCLRPMCLVRCQPQTWQRDRMSLLVCHRHLRRLFSQRRFVASRRPRSVLDWFAE